MTKKELNILIEHGDISEKGYPSALFSEIFFSINSPGKTELFFLSNKFVRVLKDLFEWYLEIELNGDAFLDGEGGEANNEKVKGYLKFYSPAEEDQEGYYREMIKENYHELRKLCLIIDPVFGDKPEFPERLKNVGIDKLLEVGTDLIHTLKFDILEGNTVEFFSFPFEKDLPKFYLLDNFFRTADMQTIYKAVALKSIIEHQQRIINKKSSIRNSESKLSHRLEAIIHKYKEDAGYSDSITRTDMRKLAGKNREIAFDSIGYFGKSKNKKFRMITKSELEKVIMFLHDFPNALNKAKSDLDSIKNS